MESSMQEKIKRIIDKALGYEVDYRNISDNTNLLENLSIDSLLILQIIVRIEQEFNIYIDDDTAGFEMLSSLNNAVQLIKNLQKEQNVVTE